jgi:hypothetical protein
MFAGVKSLILDGAVVAFAVETDNNPVIAKSVIPIFCNFIFINVPFINIKNVSCFVNRKSSSIRTLNV